MANAANVTSVMLCRCGSFTHSFDSDTRVIKVDVKPTNSPDELAGICPNKFIVLPGLYLLFAMAAAPKAVAGKPGTVSGKPSTVPEYLAVPSVGIFVTVKAKS